MINKQGQFESWILRVKLILLDMGVFTSDTVDSKILPEYWKDLYDGELTPMNAIREQGLYRECKFSESEEYLKYIKRI